MNRYETPPPNIPAINAAMLAVAAAPLLMAVLGYFPNVIAPAVISSGLFLILAIIRRINRRDDPRHQKPPPDAP
ncbi:MAG TPA: hypothetical protein VGM05_12020 [Planctomycetaceae bacterium]